MNIIRGDQATIDYSIYGWDDSNRSYFEDSYKKLSGVIKDTASSTFHNVKNIYNRYHDSEIIKRAKQLLRRTGAGVRDENVITRYYDPRRANSRMREFIMANEQVHDMHKRNILDGYSDTDYMLDEIMRRANYALATDGVYQDDGTCTNYWLVDGIDIDEDSLDIEEQAEIEITWDAVSRYINTDLDPTDKI